jgi:hypothetical protein
MSQGFGNIDPKDQQRALLDQLMGISRNSTLEEQAKPRKLYERDVCRLQLTGMSPWILLKDTKSEDWVRSAYAKLYRKQPDWDPSELSCDAALLSQYEALTPGQRDKYGCDYDLLVVLDELVSACDRKKKRNEEHLEQKEGSKVTEEDVKQIADISDKIKEKMEQAEQLGEEGEVDESLKVMQEVETLQQLKRQIEGGNQVQQRLPEGANLRKTTVCEITGDIIDGAAAADDAWMKSHFEGRDYVGWKEVREKYVELRGKGLQKGIPGYRHDDEKYSSGDRSSPKDRTRDRDRHDRDRRGDRDRCGLSQPTVRCLPVAYTCFLCSFDTQRSPQWTRQWA